MNDNKDEIKTPLDRLYEFIFFPIGFLLFLFFKFKIRPILSEESAKEIEFLFAGCLIGLLFILTSNISAYLSNIKKGRFSFFLIKKTPKFFKLLGCFCILVAILAWACQFSFT